MFNEDGKELTLSILSKLLKEFQEQGVEIADEQKGCGDLLDRPLRNYTKLGAILLAENTLPAAPKDFAENLLYAIAHEMKMRQPKQYDIFVVDFVKQLFQSLGETERLRILAELLGLIFSGDINTTMRIFDTIREEANVCNWRQSSNGCISFFGVNCPVFLVSTPISSVLYHSPFFTKEVIRSTQSQSRLTVPGLPKLQHIEIEHVVRFFK